MKKKLMFVLCLLPVFGCNMTTEKPNEREEPFSFGVIADIQYADKKSGGARHYRESLGKLKECVEELNKQKLAFTIQLGDLIDGNKTPEKTLADLNSVLEVYSTLSMPQYHVIGNHCLRAGKKELKERLKLNSFYYDFTVPEAKEWRFIVLDGNDAGYGVIGVKQLEWLKSKLAEAQANKEKVILFNHFALLKSAAKRHRMKKPESVLKLINEYDCVVAYFAGHDHGGGYSLQDGIHHVTLKGMVEAPPRNTFAVIRVSPTKLEKIGFGKEPSREMNRPVKPGAQRDGLNPAP